MEPLTLILSCIGLLLFFAVIAIILPRVLNKKSITEQTILEGYSARATVISSTPTGQYSSGQPEIVLVLKIERPTSLPFQATVKTTVYTMNLPKFQEQAKVHVKVFEDRKGKHVVVKGTLDYP
ncbi:hypothetical protein PaeCFBP13512_22850 [Paenibacillus sp. CFBP13512]|uniref:hypothetical protein n=1 Tax=Paenibacillus sp. CFBP13512 TaxID=2184007 RepID=UPI0010C11114|nr:hypothetical protein [Paenibacillus sp. CFBP13512]TKJ83395.1 hypothetical protein PaeCFBP13512_22850 [Paenibacillus sp. CFBP13512]